MNKLDYKLYIKLVIILYILFISIIYSIKKENKYLYICSQFINKKCIKIGILILIFIASYYDITISLLLTVILIINILIYIPPKKNILPPKGELARAPEAPLVRENFVNLNNSEELDSTSKITENKSNSEEKPLITDNDDIIYKKNIHISLDNLLPDTTKMDNIQNNLYNKNAPLNISPLKEQYDHQGIGVISGYDEISYYPLT
jgi:hypothetical protein